MELRRVLGLVPCAEHNVSHVTVAFPLGAGPLARNTCFALTSS
jgi:hypothetical protein